MNSYTPIDLHAKKSQALIVHCADPRFQRAHRAIIDKLGHYYDLLVLPGASKAIADNKLVLENIKLLHEFHKFETIHVFDHIECGAFGKIEDEVKAHQQYLNKARGALSAILPEVTFTPHLLGEKAEIELA